MCKACEKINNRAKYLEGKVELGAEEQVELQTIYQLWATQRLLGYEPPRTPERGKTPVIDQVHDLLAAYDERARRLESVSEDAVTAPPELLKWLIEPLTHEPEYYTDEVYEELKEKYKPMLSIDEKSMMPIYDTTYQKILDVILERFYEYEDKYYEND